MFQFEQGAKAQGFHYIIGVDEAGRGPLAGPVVASAVCLRSNDFENPIRDSKKLSPKRREKAFVEIYEKAYVGVGIISETVIDDVNILEATYTAMNRAIEDCLSRIPDYEDIKRATDTSVLMAIDGNQFKSEIPHPFRTIVGGDDRVASIAAASIIAKVTRDRILYSYDQVFPEYGFSKHKGYGTVAHREAIREHGPSLIQRHSFTVK